MFGIKFDEILINITMRYLTFVIAMFIISCNRTAHEESNKLLKDIVFPFDKGRFDWTNVESKIDNKEKIKFGEARPWLVSMHANTYLSNTHPLDINDDGQMDLIYSGPGPVTYYTIISIGNNGDDFSFDGYIVDLQIRSKKLSRLYLVSTGGPAVYGQTIVDISFDNNRPVFKTIFKNETIQGIQIPKQNASYEVDITSDTLIARDAPLELDTPYNYMMEIEGNRLGLLTKGTSAKVIGEHVDSLKNQWLCALVYPKYKIIKYPYMNMRFDSADGTTRMVWIQSNGTRRRN